ncbi:hypothetical protein [Sphingobium aquiterrae]|uniref:hypothetical protein n=1 Tax=Sphingobium aquiterrae TaxID=2038656 RepID=UPI00301A5795
MKIRVSILTIMLASCSPTDSHGDISHVPISVAGVTYQWPVDSSPELHEPAKWKGHGVISASIWNEIFGQNAALRADPRYGKEIYLTPAKSNEWGISEDGKGLPLFGSNHYVIKEKKEGYSIGTVEGDGIVSPSTVVIYKNEPNAYTECGPQTCIVFLNDRGVQHTISLRYGEWAAVPAMLQIYRRLLSIPAST